MKTRHPSIFLVLIICSALLACSGPQALSKATVTPEPTSTPTPIPGWNKFQAEEIEIWLPGSYEGGDMKNDLEVIINNLRKLGQNYEQVATMLEENPSAFVLWVFDSNLGASGYLTSMNISHEQVLSTMTLDKYVEAMEKQFSSYFTITERKNVKLGQYEAARLIVEMDVAGITAKELVYIIKDKNIVWGLTYATEMSEFEGRLPDFEQSASTFHIQP